MSVRFDDSLPLLLATLRAAGIDLSQPADTADAGAVVIVRETTGRLLTAWPKGKAPAGLAAAITFAIGAYAAPAPVVDGRLAERLAADPAVRPTALEVAGEWAFFRLVDRRLVGADWLRDPVLGSPPWPPRFVFGSLKGGVGRSTAIAVLAADLAGRGQRVLVVDLDLEAPGVGFLLLPASDDPRHDRRPRFGVIDYLMEGGIGGVADEDLVDFLGTSPLVNGLVHVRPAAGRVTDDHPANMMAKLSRSMVERVAANGQRFSVAQNAKAMIDRFVARESYDVVLVDARAGMAELSAAGLFGIGAHRVLLFGTDQQQTFRGYRYLMAHLVDTWGASAGDEADWRARLSFVHAKAPSARSKRQPFRERLYELCADQLYDQDDLSLDARIFNFPPEATGTGVPHDALHVGFHPDYEAFDPVVDDRTQLDEEVYRGPFGDFLARAGAMLAEEQTGSGSVQ